MSKEKELEKLKPVTILITSFNRINLLKKTIQYINERTFYPYRIIVIDNNSTDGSTGYLKESKVQGKIFDSVLLEENIGQSKALNIGFQEIDKWEMGDNRPTRPSNDFFVTTNEDIFVPNLGNNCWLTQMIDILERHEPEFGGICGRIQRTPRTDIDENNEIIPLYKNFPSVYRLMRRSDFRQLGDKPFGFLRKWDSNSVADKFKLQLKKQFCMTTKIYFDHAGFMVENKGFPEGTDTWTVAENKKDERLHKPYPDIDSETNIPTKIHHKCDSYEQQLREEAGDIKETKSIITVIVLTCKRLDGLQKVIKSIKEKTNMTNYELLVVADNDSTESYNWCVENGIECILSNTRRDFVAQANMGVYTCKTPYFVVLGDDQEVITNDWLDSALIEFQKRFPDGSGLMSFNENIQHGRIFTCGMSSKKFVYDIGGHLYHPSFIHFKGDRHTTEIAKSLNKYHYAEDIIVDHFHPTNPDETKRNSMDETYKQSKTHLSSDREVKASLLVEEKNYYDYKTKYTNI